MEETVVPSQSISKWSSLDITIQKIEKKRKRKQLFIIMTLKE